MKPINKLALLLIVGLLVYAAVQKQGPAPEPVGPIIGKGMRVLIVEETANRSKLPAEQSAILTSGSIQDYLNAHCAKEDSGKPAWRILDKDTDTANEAKFWQDAMSRPHPELPWIIVSRSPGRGWEGKLPVNTDATLELLKKYE